MSGGLTREVTRRGQNRTPTKAGPHVAKNRASRLGVGRRDTAWRKPQVQRGRPGPARGLGPLFYRGRTLAAAGQPHNHAGRGKLDAGIYPWARGQPQR